MAKTKLEPVPAGCRRTWVINGETGISEPVIEDAAYTRELKRAADLPRADTTKEASDETMA